MTLVHLVKPWNPTFWAPTSSESTLRPPLPSNTTTTEPTDQPTDEPTENPTEPRIDCFTKNLRTSGPVLKQVRYSSDEDCTELCLNIDGLVRFWATQQATKVIDCFVIEFLLYSNVRTFLSNNARFKHDFVDFKALSNMSLLLRQQIWTFAQYGFIFTHDNGADVKQLWQVQCIGTTPSASSSENTLWQRPMLTAGTLRRDTALILIQLVRIMLYVSASCNTFQFSHIFITQWLLVNEY